MAGQNVTLQFGPTADKLGARFWNAQDALLRWAGLGGKTGLVDSTANFRVAGEQPQPRLVSVLPVDPKEVVAELEGDEHALCDVRVATAVSPRTLFPHIDLNKQTIHRANVAAGDRDRDRFEPFWTGLAFRGLDEDVLESVRYFAEECDQLRVIQAFSADDQFGGLGARIMEQIADGYDKKLRVVYSVPCTDRYTWDAKALLLHSHRHSNVHIPFALMKPDLSEWQVPNYELLSILASSIDTCLSATTHTLPSDAVIASIAFGMRMECDSVAKPVEAVIDLSSMASPAFDGTICTSNRSACPSYIKVDGCGYVAHHTAAICGTPAGLPDHLERVARSLGGGLKKADFELYSEICAYLLDQADK